MAIRETVGTIFKIIFFPIRIFFFFIGKIVKGLPSAFFGLEYGAKETAQTIKEKRALRRTFKVIYFMGDGYYDTDAVVSQDMMFASPTDAHRSFHIKKIYRPMFIKGIEDIEKPNLLIISDENPETLDFKNPPTIDEFERLVVTESEKKGKLTKSVDIEKFNVVGGKILSKIAYWLYIHQVLQFLIKPTRENLIYIIVAVGSICTLLGFFTGIATIIGLDMFI